MIAPVAALAAARRALDAADRAETPRIRYTLANLAGLRAAASMLEPDDRIAVPVWTLLAEQRPELRETADTFERSAMIGGHPSTVIGVDQAERLLVAARDLIDLAGSVVHA